MKVYSLLQLATYLQRVVAMNFPEPIWVRAEILHVKESRGHTYLELVEKDHQSEVVNAQLSAALWFKQKAIIQEKLADAMDVFLQEGTEVSLMVEVSFHTVFGLTLSVVDLDPAYTLGRLALSREQTISRLKKEQLLDRNAGLSLPPVLQKIAVISASTSAGYQDFLQHLAENEYGYDFDITLFPTAMQGINVQEELRNNLNEIALAYTDYDCVVIIRGGGSKLDLHAFDRLELARDIAKMNIPVLTGIGHDTDQSVADLVSHKSFKTPTAVAAFLIDRSLQFETGILTLVDQVEKLVMRRLQSVRDQLLKTLDRIQTLPRQLIETQRSKLDHVKTQLQMQQQFLINSERAQIQKLTELLMAYDPKNTLARGYVFSLQDGAIVKRASQLQPGDSLETIFQDGRTLSRVDKITLNE